MTPQQLMDNPYWLNRARILHQLEAEATPVREARWREEQAQAAQRAEAEAKRAQWRALHAKEPDDGL